MTFGGHLEVLRRMLLRIAAVSGALAVSVFCFKDTAWRLLLAPSERQFATYRWIEQAAQAAGYDFHFEAFSVDLIATDLSSQFMTHITTSVYLGLLGHRHISCTNSCASSRLRFMSTSGAIR